MKIQMICVGKIKETYLRELIDHYTKIIRKKYNFEIIELPDEKTPDNASDIVNEQIKNKEGERILSAIKDDAYVCALAIEGKMLDSVELSEKIERLGIEGTSNITFVIGGSLGLADAVLKRADYKLSFSKMTFPHQLMRVILLEQIYRAYRIMKNEPYHK